MLRISIDRQYASSYLQSMATVKTSWQPTLSASASHGHCRTRHKTSDSCREQLLVWLGSQNHIWRGWTGQLGAMLALHLICCLDFSLEVIVLICWMRCSAERAFQHCFNLSLLQILFRTTLATFSWPLQCIEVRWTGFSWLDWGLRYLSVTE